jgi:hypothetical protein
VNYDATPAAYGKPHPDSAFHSRYDNGAMLLDAVAWNTGRVVVRKLDGTYYAMNHATSAANQGDPDILAGGDLTADFSPTGNTNLAPNAMLPEKVTVTFPFKQASLGYKHADTQHLPYPLAEVLRPKKPK